MNSKQATIPGTYATDSPPRTSSLPPDPLRRDMEITGSGGNPDCGDIPMTILKVTAANYEAHASAVFIQDARNGLRNLSQSCRWLHAKSLRIYPSPLKLQPEGSISTDHETR